MKIQTSIIVPFFNAERTLERCLCALKSAVDETMEVILVDDGSTDHSFAIAGAFGFRLVKTRGRVGAGSARNLGASFANGSFLIFVDSDVLVRPDTFHQLIETYHKRGNVVGVSAIYSDQPVKPGLYQELKALEETEKYQAYHANAYDSFDPHCALIEKDLFLELGGFDSSYRGADMEDAEFGYRLAKVASNSIDPTIQVDHVYSSFGRGLWNYFRRSFLWSRLFLSRLRFDQAVTTKANAISVGLSFLVIPSAIAAFFLPPVRFLCFALTIAFFCWHLRLWKLALKKYQASLIIRFPLFLFYLLSLRFVVGLGIVFGILYWPVVRLRTQSSSKQKVPSIQC